ncbi:ketosteroid isomerase family protein [Thermocoleostomius sinensis]|uniref:Nuclear transport factor 2 family protein n=1 Tax=Thermocoleostomius sinensis A174 TaxID=2016057 RepID=A0A9E9CAH2_9CYAN|nr:ketosteroid isomerase family protein [Thermocoleostomius sinensis]WAL58940.1 nuclear transport factor 2 family protein [Thermocoleostomius sinensis A174]
MHQESSSIDDVESQSSNDASNYPSDMAEGFIEFTTSDSSTSKAIVSRYFDLLNTGDFQATAALFAEEGVLDPPFDSPVVGQKAIVQYLETEAKGLQLFPNRYRREAQEDGTEEYQVGGRVQTPLFSINIGWKFVLNSAAEILLVKVKLLASLEELLKLKS